MKPSYLVKQRNQRIHLLIKTKCLNRLNMWIIFIYLNLVGGWLKGLACLNSLNTKERRFDLPLLLNTIYPGFGCVDLLLTEICSILCSVTRKWERSKIVGQGRQILQIFSKAPQRRKSREKKIIHCLSLLGRPTLYFWMRYLFNLAQLVLCE